jgi:crotonobetainyl-CoA:carnitine CoA-transferase CaiB-like acyl-CoA transferase
MHLDHFLTDLAFSTNQARVQNRQALNATLQQVFSRKDRAQWLSTLRAEGVPAAQIRTLPEVFALPEAKALVLEGYTPEGLPVRCVRTAVFRMQP